MKIDKELQQRVREKRIKFIDSLKGLNLKVKVIKEIEELSDSMEFANRIGETELAKQYRDMIKKCILSNR